jgi:hypothetical protein
MKKISLIAMTTLTVFMCSCNKKEDVQPVSENMMSTPVAQVNSFNEHNSTALTWNQLPENLRNAEIISSANAAGALSKTAASFITSVGPWGGGGGAGYSIYPLASTDKIYAIGIRSGGYVDGLSVWYIRTNGTLYAYVVGGTGGTFYFQPFSTTEHITAIGGRSGTYLDRLTIYTTYKSFSYGGNGGAAFYAGAGTAQILGFYGGAGTYVDRIGAYLYTY